MGKGKVEEKDEKDDKEQGKEEKEREGPLLPRVVIPPSRRREWGK